MLPTMSSMDLRGTANELRGKMLRGEVTFDEAIATLKPLVAEADKRGAVIAKEFGKRYKKINMSALLR